MQTMHVVKPATRNILPAWNTLPVVLTAHNAADYVTACSRKLREHY